MRAPAQRRRLHPPATDARPLDPGEVDGLLAIHADGSVTLYTSKVDVGTGVRIALAQMAAEELGVAPARISVVEGDTASMPRSGRDRRQHGPHARRHGDPRGRRDRTARRCWSSAPRGSIARLPDLTIVDGEVRPLAGGAGVGIGTLIGDRRFALKVDRQGAAYTRGTTHVASASRC